MKTKKYACKDCGKIKLINVSKNSYEKYIAKYPRCHRCGAKYAESKLKNTWFKKGVQPWNKGIKDNNSHSWKGDNAGYDAMHDWVKRRLGKPMICEHCGTTKKHVYQWSNKSGEYKRDLTDWQRLCVTCHHRYDYKKFGNRKSFYE